MMDEVVLVDENDNQTGLIEKMEAHRKGLLHRAISVFVYNSKGELLLQQRAMKKYHGGGLWTNTCCSHPLPDEEPKAAARRRLMQEMGMDAEVSFSHTFIYKADVGNGLWEHELDHVFTAVLDVTPKPNPEEAMAWRYISMDELKREVEQNPETFSAWLRIILHDPSFRLTHVV